MILRTLSVLTGLLSIIIVWSEMTFFKKQPVLSIFALMVNMAKQNNDYVMIQVIHKYINITINITNLSMKY